MKKFASKLNFHLIQEICISILYNLKFRHKPAHCCDSLTLYDGDSNSALMIGKINCGNSIPNNQKSSTNSVLIHFESDPKGVTKKGFKLQYQGFDQKPGK